MGGRPIVVISRLVEYVDLSGGRNGANLRKLAELLQSDRAANEAARRGMIAPAEPNPDAEAVAALKRQIGELQDRLSAMREESEEAAIALVAMEALNDKQNRECGELQSRVANLKARESQLTRAHADAIGKLKDDLALAREQCAASTHEHFENNFKRDAMEDLTHEQVGKDIKHDAGEDPTHERLEKSLKHDAVEDFTQEQSGKDFKHDAGEDSTHEQLEKGFKHDAVEDFTHEQSEKDFKHDAGEDFTHEQLEKCLKHDAVEDSTHERLEKCLQHDAMEVSKS